MTTQRCTEQKVPVIPCIIMYNVAVTFESMNESVNINSVPTEISCFHDYGQKLALSLLYYLKIGRKNYQD